MSGGAGSDEADGTSRSPEQSDAEQERFGEQGRFGQGVQHDRWVLDEHGVWRERRRTAGNRPPRSPAPSGADQAHLAADQRDEQWSLDEHGVWRERRLPAGSRPRRSRRKLGGLGRVTVIGAAVLAFVLVLAFGVFGSKNAAATGGFQPTATKPAPAARQTAQAFLAAWQNGDVQKAASYTDHPAAAAAALNSYRNGLYLQALHLAVRLRKDK
jgi:hypothetical protein